MTTLRLTLFSWLIGCALAILAIQLTGCGQVTQVSTDVSGSESPSIRGEVSSEVLDSGGSADLGQHAETKYISAPDAGEDSGSGERVDGAPDNPVSKSDAQGSDLVCPPHLTCDVTSAECRALCPSCTEKQDGKCISDGYCVCRDGRP